MEDFKVHIEQTRTGNVGSSDSRMLQQIAELGKIPHSATKRMAIIKGLCENDNITTKAMRLGDYVEEMTFASLYANDSRWESNKFLKSDKYSRKNCGCITHIDYWLQDDEKKVITIGEQKATVLNYAQAYDEYKYQIYHHFLLTKEYADKIGYAVKVLFCVYNTNNIEEDHTYDPSRLTVKQLRSLEKLSKSYRLGEAMDIVNDYLEKLEFYTEDEVVNAALLPANVQSQFSEVAQFLREIKEREAKVESFKAKLYDFLSERGISKVKCDDFAFTVVAPTQQVTFDAKKYLADMEEKHPRKAKQVREKYKKVSNKRGYVKISVSDNNND